MSGLTRLSVRGRWLTLAVAAVVTLASVWAITSSKMELIPDIEFPLTSVVTVYPGASSEQVAEEVTVPVEDAIAAAGKTKKITSTSVRNMSLVLAEYDFGTDMDAVRREISRNLEGLSLPEGAQTPTVFPMSMDVLPVVSLSLGGETSTAELRSIAASQIVPRLEAIEGVFKVDVEGGKEQAIVTLDVEKTNQAGIAAAQVASVLAARRFGSLGEIEATPLAASAAGDSVPSETLVRDVGTVALGPAQGSAITRTNGKPSVSILVTKHPGANTVEVANAVVAEVGRIRETLGDSVELVTVLDQSEFIERAIRQLYREALIGAVLAVVAILLFLMAFRASLVTALSIPLSVLMGFLAMRLWGLSINLLTISAMALAVGRVVDDAIVVLEVVYRHLKRGEEFREAAVNGAREVAGPITSATVATVVVFIPLAFVGGIVGELFRPFALTVTFALMASLLVALTVVPVLSSLARPKEIEAEARPTWYQRLYVPSLRWALGHRALTLTIAGALSIGSFGLLPFIGTTFLPASSEKIVTVEVETPLGSDLEATAQKAAQVEELVGENLDWRVYSTTVGTSTRMGGMASFFGGSGSNRADILVILQRDADLQRDASRLRELVGPIAGDSNITVSDSSERRSHMAGGSDSLAITVSGDDPQALADAVAEVTALLEKTSGLVNVESDTALAIPQPVVQLDPAALARHGIAPEGLQKDLELLMRGAAVGKLDLNGEEYDVFLAPLLRQVRTEQQLRGLRIGTDGGVSLGEIATAGFQNEPTHVRRVDRQAAVQVTADIVAKDVGAVNRQVTRKLRALTLPPQVKTEMGGVFAQMTEGFRWMGIAILVAIGIAYLVLVLTFRSFLDPFVIMFSLPVASIGALLGLFITGRPLGMSALMGMLMLVGIVLTNAIVLIALVDQLRKRGLSAYEALEQGGSTRLRPILMTATATMSAMLPLALGFGEGTIIAAELATVVIGGLFTSTLLTLVVVPVVYSLFDGFRRRAPSPA